MKLSEFTAAPAPEPIAPEASPEPEEPQFVTSVTPSGIQVYYSWEPRRHYKLRPGDASATFSGEWREVPSVTTVLSVLDKSGALTWWGMKVGVEGVQSLTRDGAIEQPHVHSSDHLVQLLTDHKLTVNHVKDKAADRGVNVHEALERWAEDRPLLAEDEYEEHERGYVAGLYEFFRAIESDVCADATETELMVGSLQHQYAGRFDLVLTLAKPVEVVTKTYPKRKPKIEEIPAGRYLLDLKTSKRVYDTHYLQLEAYEAAAVECGYAPTDYRGVVHVTADGTYELCLNKDWTFEDFLSVRQCYQTMNERRVIQALRDELGAEEVA